jgi:GNAT superfamily N-acetyltransferase
MIRGTQADLPAIKAFLRTYLATAMFPLANLDQYGMAGGHPRAMSFWMSRQAGVITDVLAVTDEGMIFPNCPTHAWKACKVALAGREICGILGADRQVTGLRQALGLTYAAGQVLTEPHYHLDLAALVLPDVTGFALQPIANAPRDLVIGWRRAYLVETMMMQGDNIHETAIKDIDAYAAADSHFVLFDGDRPVAMTGFNARLPDTVQVGGVYTPPDLRGRGLARRALALHLARVRAAGVTQAVLFAATAEAARAYEAIGFTRIGDFGIAMCDVPQVVHV